MNPSSHRIFSLAAATLVGACSATVAGSDAPPDAAVADAPSIADARPVFDVRTDAPPRDDVPAPRVADFVPCGVVGVSRVHRAVPSPDGATIALATHGRQVVVVSASDGAVVLRIEAHAGEVYDVAFSEDGATLFSWGDDGVLRAWASGDGALRWSAPHRNRASLHRARVAVRGQRVAVGGPPAEVFDARTGASLLTLDHPGVQRRMGLDTNGNEPGVVAISPDGTQFAAAQGETVYLFDREGRATGRTLAGDLGTVRAGAYPAEIRNLTFSPEGDALLVATQRGYVVTSAGERFPVARLYRMSDGAAITTLSADSPYGVSAALSPDGARVAVSSGGRVDWWTVRGPGGWLTSPAAPVRTGIFASDVLVDAAGRVVANASTLAVRLHALDRADPLVEVPAGDLDGRVLAFTPDGARMLRSTTLDDRLELWTLGRAPRRQRTLLGASRVADLSPDGARVVTARGAAIEERPVEGGAARLVATASAPVLALAYAPDGRSILEAHDGAGTRADRPSELTRWSGAGERLGVSAAVGRVEQIRRTHRGDAWISVGPSRNNYRGPQGVDLWPTEGALRAVLHVAIEGSGRDCADVSRDGASLFMSEWINPVRAVRTADAAALAVDPGVHATRLAFSPSEDLLVRGDDRSNVLLARPDRLSPGQRLAAPCAGPGCGAPTGVVTRLVFSRDGRTLAVSTDVGDTRLYCRAP